MYIGALRQMFVLMLTLIYCSHFWVGVVGCLLVSSFFCWLAVRSLPPYVLSCVVVLFYLDVWRMLLCVVFGNGPLM
jgi:hypothetical protein